jgi:MSHA biogenesis protein MshJ
MIKRYWQSVAARVDELTLRQRGMLFATVSLALVAVAHIVLIEPKLVQQKALIERAKRDQSQLAAVRAQIESTIRSLEQDPEQVALRALEARVAEAGKALAQKKDGLAAASSLPGLVKELLGKGRGVKLETLRVLPGVQVEGSQLYRHGVQLTLVGGYFDLVQYLSELERVPARLLWGSGELRVEQYPEVRLTLEVFTLNPQRSLGL